VNEYGYVALAFFALAAILGLAMVIVASGGHP
jgi:hypothetical protein